jgi:hypothetical protein
MTHTWVTPKTKALELSPAEPDEWMIPKKKVLEPAWTEIPHL